MTREFRTNEDSAIILWLAAGLFAFVMWAFGLTLRGVERVIVHGLVLVLAGLSFWGFWALLDRRVLLRIGPDGLYYRWFAPQTVPWPEITRMEVITSVAPHGWAWENKWRRVDTLDVIAFAIADPGRYPHGAHRRFNRAVMTLDGRPPIAITTWYVDGATTAELVDEISRHWPGVIERREVALPPR